MGLSVFGHENAQLFSSELPMPNEEPRQAGV